MKKVISLILAVCLIAAMAVSASAATVVTHDQTSEETTKQIEHAFCDEWNWLYKNYNWPSGQELALLTADYVKVLDITEDTTQTLTTCAQAITVKELQAICEENEDINNLTVFRQRNVEAEGAIDITVKLWSCNPEKKSNQAVVILYRAEDSEEWSVVGYNNEKSDTLAANECSATLAGSGAYVVAMAW